MSRELCLAVICLSLFANIGTTSVAGVGDFQYANFTDVSQSPDSIFGDQGRPIPGLPAPQPESAPQTLPAELWSDEAALSEYVAQPQTTIQMSPAQYDTVVEETWQLMPEGLLYHSYLAGEKEPRFAAQWMWEQNRGLVWETAVGGRWGLFRKGTEGPNGEGFQFDVIGGAFVRIDPEEESDVEAADFNAGFLGTWRTGRWRFKLGYNHYSCHVGDEYLIKNPTFVRNNYVRDSILGGVMFDVTPKLQVYGEVYNALGTGGSAEPWELQFGVQYAPSCETGFRGAPFFAVNGHLREEYDFGGNVNAQIGWAWRSGRANRLFRVGAQHYNGQSMQWSFADRYENMTGIGMWFDY
ncbi:DUF1207 domain-containing protein [Planctomicrobium sp. SH527]|uniref:DUF1207 domain-containing protein n=1 Tax=Planctomicrobium sp. SH527 TaxID=3448123 RepID=UPI003F5B2709